MHIIWELDYVHRESISAFVCSLQCIEGNGVEGTAVVHSCQNHVDKQWSTSSAAGSIPAQATFFLKLLDLFRTSFFSVITTAFASTLIANRQLFVSGSFNSCSIGREIQLMFSTLNPVNSKAQPFGKGKERYKGTQQRYSGKDTQLLCLNNHVAGIEVLNSAISYLNVYWHYKDVWISD